MGIAILLVIGALTTLYFFVRNKLNYWKSRGVAHDEPSLILGNLDGVGQTIHLNVKIQVIYEKHKIGNKFCGFYLLQSPRVIVIDPEIIRNILVKDFHNFADRGVYNDPENDVLSGHLFALDGEKWKNLRHKLSSTFTSGKLKLMFPIIASFSKDLVNLVDELSSNELGVDIKNVAFRFTADVIGSVGFGIECGALKDENSEMMKMGNFFDIRDIKTRINFFFVNVFPNIAKKLKMKLTPPHMTEFFMRVVKETYDYRLNNNVNRNDFMSLLMQIKKYGKLHDDESEVVGQMTFNEMAAQAFIFFVAGFDTSSTTIQMALYELGYRPQIQTKLREEITRVLAKHNGTITYEALAEMTYLEQVVNETLRLYTPIAQLFRIPQKDYKVPDTDFVIEKGTPMIIPVNAIHHDSRYYYDPSHFNPERFAPEEVKKRPPYTFLPFGDGPRNCIGMRFGYLQSKLGIATIIKNFEVELHENTRYPLIMDNESLVVTSMGKMYMKVKRI